MKSISRLLKQLWGFFLAPVITRQDFTATKLDEILMILDAVSRSLGRIESKQMEFIKGRSINDHEFKVFSQWGEDGIIQFLINHIQIKDEIFIEIGVDDYKESNTRFLLVNNNWSGLVIDHNQSAIDRLKSDRIYWLYNIKAVVEFIMRDNVNNIIADNGIKGEIGLLSIDIDGNDYWIWEKIDVISPIIVIIEYNYRFGKDLAVTIPYNEDFDRVTAHYSHIYFGASLRALYNLGMKKGYAFVGCCSNGVNAFFVRKDMIPAEIDVLTIENGFFKGQFSEYRDISGNMIKSTPDEEIEMLNEINLPLVDISE